jgi:uncharacterized protein YbjT (DUF2867 family)
MSIVNIPASIHREPELLGQTVLVIGGSAGIGFETARRAHAEGAKVILTGRNAERLQHAAGEVDALSTAAFDAADPVALESVTIAAAARLAKRLNVDADRRTPRDRPADTKVFANTFVQLSRCNTSGLIVRKELR